MPSALGPAFTIAMQHSKMTRAPMEYPTSVTGRDPCGRDCTRRERCTAGGHACDHTELREKTHTEMGMYTHIPHYALARGTRTSSVCARSLPALAARSRHTLQSSSMKFNAEMTYEGHAHAANKLLISVCFSASDT